MGSLRILVRNRGLARCETVWALSALGGWAFSIIFGLYAYYEHGPGGVAMAVAVRMLPAALIMQLGVPSPLRRRIGSARASLLVSTLGRFVMLEAVAVVVSFEGPFGILLALAAGFETAGMAHSSARAQMLSELARTPTELAVANASRIATWAGLLAGGIAAGILVGVTGMDTAFAVSGLAFLAAAVVAWSLPAVLAAVDERLPLIPRFRALGAVGRNRFARIRIGWFSAAAFVDAALDLLLVITALDLLGIGGSGVGWLRAAFAAGGLLGGMAAWSALRSGRLAVALGIGAGLAGIPLALIAAWPSLAPAALLVGLLGVGFALVEVTLSLLTGRLAAGEMPAEIVGLEELLYPFARAIGAGVSAWCVVAFGDNTSLVVFGLVLPVIGLIGLWPMWRAERRIEVPRETFESLRSALPALSTTLLEELALVSQEVRFRSGETVPAHGSLYVLTRGSVRRHGDRIGVGEAFGDPLRSGADQFIAEGDVRAVVIPRDTLLACAAGRPAARAAASDAPRRERLVPVTD
ncbi:MAG TPA: hypothetical protein VGI87_04045 [Solirubrobacteraceae bacterium]